MTSGLQLSPPNLGLENHTSSWQPANWALECSVPDNFATCQENWSLHAHIQDNLPPHDEIEQLMAVFFCRISPVISDIQAISQQANHIKVFCVVDQFDFEQEWQTFKYNCALFNLSWNALLLMILSLAHRADKEYNRVHDGISIEFELLARKCLSQDNFNASYSIPGLKALLLISYLQAHRGFSISALAKRARRIAHNFCFANPKEERDVSNGIATLLSLSFHLSKRPGDDVVKFQIEYPGTWSSIHAELDEMTYRISEYVRLSYSHSVDQLEGRLESLRNYLLALKQGFQHMDQNYVNCVILEGRVHYLVHHLSSPGCLLTNSLGKDKSIEAARKVLYTFNELVLQENQPMWWYLKGLGSYYAADCALTLAKYSGQEEKLLDQTLEIFHSIAGHSAFCMQYLPEIEEARLHWLLFSH